MTARPESNRVKVSGMTVAALFVDPNGVYAGLPDVDVWDEARDARLYGGPYPVVAHPPCARWSRLAGFTEARFGYKRGDDGGCFLFALECVRRFGGVLEHPAYSDAWKAFNLPRPTDREGWTLDIYGGASCYVEQGRYGLPVKKATWLYAYGCELPELRWGWARDGDGLRQEDERPVGVDRWRDRWGGRREALVSWAWRDDDPMPSNLGTSSTTPPLFRDVLLDMARSASRVTA